MIPVGAILHGPHWPSPVRVVRVEPRGNARVLVEAVTLDGGARLLSRLFHHEELAGLQVELEAGRPALDGNPLGFRLAAEATRIRLAYTHDPQFAASVARIDPLPHQLEAVYHYMLRQPRLRFLLTDDPGAGLISGAGPGPPAALRLSRAAGALAGDGAGVAQGGGGCSQLRCIV